ncbi:MAG: hypothetical protein HY039_10630 [Nitrospirae bacterium]|nr:hypothetical protein [Nitrospirota bacterium]
MSSVLRPGSLDPAVSPLLVHPRGAGHGGADRVLYEEERIMLAERAGYERGFAAGEAAGTAFGREKIEAAAAGLFQLLGELDGVKRRILAQAEGEALKLAIAIARRILIREISTRGDVLKRIAAEAVAQAVEREHLTIRVNPDDLGRAMALKKDLALSVEGLKAVSVEADKSVLPGGCIVESAMGDIDARIDRQLIEIARDLGAVWRESGPPSPGGGGQ